MTVADKSFRKRRSVSGCAPYQCIAKMPDQQRIGLKRFNAIPYLWMGTHNDLKPWPVVVTSDFSWDRTKSGSKKKKQSSATWQTKRKEGVSKQTSYLFNLLRRFLDASAFMSMKFCETKNRTFTFKKYFPV